LQTQQVVDAVVAGLELAVLDVAHEPLSEDRVAVRETPGYVDATPQSLLLRTHEVVQRAAGDRPLDVNADHEVRGHPGCEMSEVVAAGGTNKVRDDVAPRPVALGELGMNERQGGCPRVLDTALQADLAEEPHVGRADH